jgi:hypothetical protein
MSELVLNGQANIEEWEVNEPAKVILKAMKRVTGKGSVPYSVMAEDLD